MSLLDWAVAHFPGHDLTPGFNLPNVGGLVPGQPYEGQTNPAPAQSPTSDLGSFLTPMVNGPSQPAPRSDQGNYDTNATSDPYAIQRSAFNTQKQNIYGTANDTARNAGIGYGSSIMDFISSLTSGQRNIDNRATNNELAKRQGTSSILDMVGRGIRSSGVQLANRNAGDSSAAGALANAYGQMGRSQLSSIGNQYEMGNRDIGIAQEDLNQQQQTGVRKFGENKQQIVNSIVGDARNQFAQLDAAMANASLPDRIAIEQEKENVRQQVLQQLQQYDQQLASANVAPSSMDARKAQAAQLQNAGTDLGQDAFNFTDQLPAQWQNSGPFASELPIFTIPRGNRQFA